VEWLKWESICLVKHETLSSKPHTTKKKKKKKKERKKKKKTVRPKKKKAETVSWAQ
jgi:hypothetical protein